MNALGHSCFGYLQKKGKLFTRKLPNIMYCTKLCKNTLRHGKTTTSCLYFEQDLHNNKMFYKACVPLDDIFFAIDIGSIAK